MSDDTTATATGNEPPEKQQAATSSAETKTAEAVPYERFKEVNDKLRETLAKVGDFEKRERDKTEADKKAEEERLKKQGEFETLASQKQAEADTLRVQLTDALAVLEKFQTVFTEGVDASLKELPEPLKALYPYDKKPVGEDLLKAYEWLTKATKAEGTKRPGSVASPKPAGAGTKTHDDALRKEIERARRW